MVKQEFTRPLVDTLVARMQEPRRFIQIVTGPRQTGKTTAILQALELLSTTYTYFSFDDVIDINSKKLRTLWQEAREGVKAKTQHLLILDELQRVDQWSSIVKALWDEDTRTGCDLKVLISGSSPLLLKKGLKESLAGRFELIHSPHWSFWECQQAFGYSLDEFLFYGGYPGAAALRVDEHRWLSYMRESIIEPTMTKDVLLMQEVRKPAVLMELFYLGAAYSAHEVSYRKILGQLQDAGNTETVANYLSMLENAGILRGLFKYDDMLLKTRSSSPRFLVFDTSLLAAAYTRSKKELLGSEMRGHVVESAIGAYLQARSLSEGFELFWWRDGNNEVDFIIRQGARRIAIEVKSGRLKSRNGMRAFLERYPGTYSLTVGSPDISVEDFLLGKVPLF